MNHSLSPTPEGRMQTLENELSLLREKYYFLETDLKKAITEKDTYQLIADYACDWELLLDSKAGIVWMSPSSNDLTGYTPDEFFKNPSLLYELIYQEDEQEVRRCIHDSNGFMQVGQSVEFRILTKTKQLRWCEMNIRGVFDKRGSYLGQRCSIRDVSRLKTALGYIREIQETQVWETKAKQRYRDEIASKERELVSSLIRLAQKNELISYVKKNLSVIKTTIPLPMQQKVVVVIEKIEEHQRLQLFNWEEFKFHFEKVHQGFFTRLNGKFPKLTAKDQRMCAYLHLGLSTKELAGLINVTAESAEIGRIRLRRKLGLNRSDNLTNFLQGI